MVYEYIKAAFGVLTGILSHNKLLILALSAIVLYGLWVTLSLLFSFERKFDINSRKIYDAIKTSGITRANAYKVNALINKMPSGFVRGWNTFRYKKKGLPSEYIKREDSLDLELVGGVFNRNRSIMKTTIFGFFAFLLLCSIAMLGDAQLTGFALAESALIPLMFLLVARIIYYIYTAIRQFQYRMAVESFNELIKMLDDCVVGSQEQKGQEDYKQEIATEQEQKVETIEEKEEVQEEIKEEIKETPAKKRGRPKLEFASGEPIIIRTDKEFEAALERAEKLMRKSEQQLSATQAKKVEKNLKELIDAMNKYREEEE